MFSYFELILVTSNRNKLSFERNEIYSSNVIQQKRRENANVSMIYFEFVYTFSMTNVSIQ